MQYDTDHANYQNSRASRIKKLEQFRYEHLLKSNSLHKRINKLAIFTAGQIATKNAQLRPDLVVAIPS